MVGLLVLTLPYRQLCSLLPKVIREASEHVTKVLYIHLDQTPAQPTKTYPTPAAAGNTRLSIQEASSLIKQIYGNPVAPPSLDIRVILTGFKKCHTIPIRTKHTVEKVMVDYYIKEQLHMFKQRYRSYLGNTDPVVLLHDAPLEVDNDAVIDKENENSRVYKDIVGGGTFDCIHSGHKILLSEGLLRCSRKFTIGVADGPLLARKTLPELIQPIDVRINNLSNLLSDLDPDVEHYLEPIYEPLGPSGRDPHMEMIIVSQETLKGGNYVNKARVERNLSVLDVEVIDLVEDKSRDLSAEEEKISSSSGRMRTLGRLIKTPDLSLKPPFPPYIVGLTGSSASGKSSIARNLASLGAGIIDCDKLGHKAYERGTACYDKLLQIYGPDILTSEQTINRRLLGAKVFSDADKLKQLNQLVWPEIAKLVQSELRCMKDKQVVVLDAAVLLEAGWNQLCHEVWVCLLPRSEAVRRITERDGCSAEEATERLSRQLSDEARLQAAHVALCSLWQPAYTGRQVQRAWDRLIRARGQ